MSSMCFSSDRKTARWQCTVGIFVQLTLAQILPLGTDSNPYYTHADLKYKYHGILREPLCRQLFSRSVAPQNSSITQSIIE
jgi:hypothetical protein